MQAINKLYSQFEKAKNVVITMHQKPDADAMGSALAMYHFLKSFGHTVTVVSPTNWADFLRWMPGSRAVIDFENRPTKATEIVNNADWIFCLDFNVLDRLKKMEEVVANASGQRILIDHHQQPQTEVFAYGISDTSKSSTCEMVYDLILDAGHEDKMTDDIAQCLYAGVMTDTGSFRFASTTPAVHYMVAKLQERGLNHSAIHSNLFDNFYETRLRFIGHVLQNRMEIFYEYNTVLISIPQADLVKFDIKTGDTEGLVNYPLSIEGIKLAAIIIDRGPERKSSFRSKDGFDVNKFARTYFNGGGHVSAAGGQNTEKLSDVVKIFKDAIEECKDELSSYNF